MAVDTDQSAEITFGPFRLDVRGRMLYRHGMSVSLGGRSLDILCALAALRGDLVTKDQLAKEVWAGAIVEENTIQAHVSALRKALGEGEGDRRYILTVPGRGYRFVNEPNQRSRPGRFDERSPRDRPSIAVLPFENLSGGAEQDYFADGVVEDII